MSFDTYSTIVLLLNEDDQCDDVIQVALDAIREISDTHERSGLLLALTIRKFINGDTTEMPISVDYVASLHEQDPYKTLGMALLAYVENNVSFELLEEVHCLIRSSTRQDRVRDLLESLVFGLAGMSLFVWHVVLDHFHNRPPETVTNAWRLLYVELKSGTFSFQSALDDEAQLPHNYAVVWRASTRVLTLVNSGNWESGLHVLRESGCEATDEIVMALILRALRWNHDLVDIEEFVETSTTLSDDIRQLFSAVLSIRKDKIEVGMFAFQALIRTLRNTELLQLYFEYVARFQGRRALQIEMDREREQYGDHEITSAIAHALQANPCNTSDPLAERPDLNYDPISFWTTYHRTLRALADHERRAR